jgi:hypothetical protein
MKQVFMEAFNRTLLVAVIIILILWNMAFWKKVRLEVSMVIKTNSVSKNRDQLKPKSKIKIVL